MQKISFVDPLGGFLAVHSAIENITKGYSLGDVKGEDDELDYLAESWIDASNKLQTYSCISNTLPINGSIQLRIRKSVVEEDWKYFEVTKLPVQEIFDSYCIPSPFGDIKKQQNRVDPTVRLAKEVANDRFQIVELNEKNTNEPKTKKAKTETKEEVSNSNSSATSIPSFLETIKNVVELSLTYCSVTLVPYKLNVYGKGGFFKSHVDSPTEPGMIGTVVVALPSEHEGGELIVDKKEISFSSKSKESLIQYAAFFSDLPHEIKPVTSGFRITITFSIVVSPNPKPVIDTVPPKVQKLIREIKKEKEHDAIGFFLNSNYTMTGLSTRCLKGSDRVLVNCLASVFKITLLPVIRVKSEENYTDGQGNDWGDPGDDSNNTDVVYAFSYEDMLYLLGKRGRTNYDFEDVPFLQTNEGNLLKHTETSPENAGNWVEPGVSDSMYFNCAVIVEKKRITSSPEKQVVDLISSEEGEEEEEEDEDEDSD